MNTHESAIAELRKKHRRLRSELSVEQLHNNAIALVDRVAQVDEFVAGDHVAAYIAIKGEIDILPLIAHFSAKSYYLPVLREQNMYFAPWKPGSRLRKKKFGLLEPDCPEKNWLDPAELDVVLVPLVVFDQQCNRIGQGGGFYDRTFEFLHSRVGVGRPALVGVAHESQREASLLVQPWDVPLDRVVTESSVYRNSGY